jgi:hypothetical protein
VRDQFDVWRFIFPDKGEHPVVLISHPDICARAAVVNVLFCTSQRQNRPIRPFEVMLNGADGMDWETFCDCRVTVAPPQPAVSQEDVSSPIRAFHSGLGR